MSEMTLALIALLGGIPLALVTYLIAARRFSGSINSTEASRLWDAGEQLRKEYHDRIESLNTRMLRLENRNDVLTRENEQLRRLVGEQAITIQKLQDEVHRLSEENKRLAEGQNGTNEH